MAGITPQFSWSENSGRYRSAETGRYVTFEEVRKAIEVVGRRAQGSIQAMSESLRAGNLSLADWQSGMAREIKLLHLSNAAAARGGWAQMTKSDFGAVGAQLKKQYQYLNRFAAQIQSGQQALDGRLIVRANLYAQAGRGTFEDMRRRTAEQLNDMDQERRILGVADHCQDCLDEAARGWQAIGTLRRIGDSVCKTNCHCHFVYRQSLAQTTAQAPGL